jgi:hypothetical protein
MMQDELTASILQDKKISSKSQYLRVFLRKKNLEARIEK